MFIKKLCVLLFTLSLGNISADTTLYIVKGGETAHTGKVWHAAATATYLTEQGKRSAASLQNKIAFWEITAAYTSPQKHVIESAQIALHGSSVMVGVCEELGPRKITPFEGMTGDQVKALYRQYHDLDLEQRITSDEVFCEEWGPWGTQAFETNDALKVRIQRFIHMVTDRHSGENVFVQTHVDWMREAYRLFTGAQITEDYTVSTRSVLILRFNSDGEFIAVERQEMPNR